MQVEKTCEPDEKFIMKFLYVKQIYVPVILKLLSDRYLCENYYNGRNTTIDEFIEILHNAVTRRMENKIEWIFS